jgi:TPR repeat protein
MRKLSLVLVTLLSFVAAIDLAAQQSPDPTQVRLNAKAYLDSLTPAAFIELLTQAQAGSAEAQYWMGLVYADGKLIPKDEQEAARWLQESAEQGDARARRTVGLMIFRNKPSEGERWLRRAGEQGDAEAQFWLGAGYEQNWFGNNNPQEALNWYRKAAEKGQPDAECELGLKYESGDGVEQNYTMAVEWYRRAANHAADLGGAGIARRSLGRLYFEGQGIPKDYVQAYMWLYVGGVMDLEDVKSKMSPAQLAETEQMIKEWKTSHPKDHSSPPLS